MDGRSGWTESLRGSGCDGSRRDGEQWPARRTAATLLDLAPRELEDGDGREGRDRTGRFEGVRVAKGGAQTPRSSAIADAWRRSAAASGGMGVGSVTVEALETTVYSLNDFDSSLTR